MKDYGVKQQIQVFKESDRLTIGSFTIDPVFVTHSVPDTYHFAITTPLGVIYHGSDYKFDLTPVDGRRPNFRKMVAVSQKGILCLLSDSLRSERSGFTPSESTLSAAIERELINCPGRLIFTTMSSQIHRIQQAIDVATQHGRLIAFVGRSMERNAATAQKLGFLKSSKKQVISSKSLQKYKDQELCLIVAGSQGQESSSLTRYAAGTHRLIKPKQNDKVIYSTDIIPGNEQAVYQVIDQMSKQGLEVVYGDLADDLHVSGHASAGEMQLLMELTDPQYVYPIGGTFRHLKRYQHLAVNQGFSREQVIIPRTSQVVEFIDGGHYRFGETLKLKQIRVTQDERKSSPRRR
jgi:ribonuclease J